MDIKLRVEEARRQRGLGGKARVVDGTRRVRVHERVSRAIPAPEANAELQLNLDRLRVESQANAKTKSEKFPPPHQDGSVGYTMEDISSQNGPVSFGASDASLNSSIFDPKSSRFLRNNSVTRARRKNKKEETHMGPSWKFTNAFHPSLIGWSKDWKFNRRRSVSENFAERR